MMTATGKQAQNGGRFKSGIAWIVFVFLVPALFAAGLLAFSLQVLGVPVLKSVERTLGLSKPLVVHSVRPAAPNLLQVERAKVTRYVHQNQNLQAQLALSQQKQSQLSAQVAGLKRALQSSVSASQAAKTEAGILTNMDATQAAPLLEKMAAAAAAKVVAAMSSSDSGPILAAMPAQTAATILSLAAVTAK